MSPIWHIYISSAITGFWIAFGLFVGHHMPWPF